MYCAHISDVEEGFMPWLMKEVKKEMGNMIESRELLMGKTDLKIKSL